MPEPLSGRSRSVAPASSYRRGRVRPSSPQAFLGSRQHRGVLRAWPQERAERSARPPALHQWHGLPWKLPADSDRGGALVACVSGRPCVQPSNALPSCQIETEPLPNCRAGVGADGKAGVASRWPARVAPPEPSGWSATAGSRTLVRARTPRFRNRGAYPLGGAQQITGHRATPTSCEEKAPGPPAGGPGDRRLSQETSFAQPLSAAAAAILPKARLASLAAFFKAKSKLANKTMRRASPSSSPHR